MSFDTLKLDKGLYTSSKGFTKALEEVDPSENYKGTERARNLKALMPMKDSSKDTILR